MSRKYAILIDAGFVRAQVKKSFHRHMTKDDVLDLVGSIQNCSDPDLKNMLLYRVFYYDAEPLESSHKNPLGGKDVDFIASSVHYKEIHNTLKGKSFFAMRLGKVAFRGWEVKPKKIKPNPSGSGSVSITHEDIYPRTQQKGVDMRISLDVAALALKRIVDVVVLITSDADFAPALKFARTEGLQVFLFSLGAFIREELITHADITITSSIKSTIRV